MLRAIKAETNALYLKVLASLEKAEEEKKKAETAAVVGGINTVSSIGLGLLGFLTPGGAIVGAIALGVNLTAAALNTAVVVYEIKNIDRCKDIIGRNNAMLVELKDYLDQIDKFQKRVDVILEAKKKEEADSDDDEV